MGKIIFILTLLALGVFFIKYEFEFIEPEYVGTVKEIKSCATYNEHYSIKCSVIFESGAGATVGNMVYIGEDIYRSRGWQLKDRKY